MHPTAMQFFLRTAAACAGLLGFAMVAPAQDARTASSYDLLMASANALKANHAEDAIFDFYAGQLRRRLEVALYPPDSEEEGEAVYALQYQLGYTVNQVAFDRPKDAERALNRYDNWTPLIPAGFKPLWKSSHPVPLGRVQPQIAMSKLDFSKHMRGMATLLQDPEYYRLFHVGRDCNLQPEGKRPTPAACGASNQGMLRIEKQRGIEGAATIQASGK